ncbi:MAG: hypothetical protein MSJ26_09760 [Oscillospiraceae bacterium]|nr:hypothetical protein [Oscillospiraceae bacterium]
MVWYKAWKPKQLLQWLDEFSPTAGFFVAGDCIFAYNIYDFIVNRYNAKASLYLTDDYILPRKKETALEKLRREAIIRAVKESLEWTSEFFTVSEVMREEYRSFLNKESSVIVNMTEPLRDDSVRTDGSAINIIYAGSLYYGRDMVIRSVAEAVEKYNSSGLSDKKVHINVYSNSQISESQSSGLFINQYIHNKGSLGKKELVKELNRSDILLFAESFDDIYIEKTKLSLSTKIPEYLSLHKPILAVGPACVGSMQYLKGVSMCVNDKADIYLSLCKLLDSQRLQAELSDKAAAKYSEMNNKEALQAMFAEKVLTSV